VDEAYFEYVSDPEYRTMIPLAITNPRVIVTRTFSKVYGMAGLRVGYLVAHEDTVARLEPMRLGSGVNALAAAAAMASLQLGDHVRREQELNREAREFTVRFLNDAGFECAPTHTNFVMFDVGRDSRTLQTACLERGVAIGRQFPPLTNYARISIGTMDEMQRALPIVRDVLRGNRTGRR
jgi:histidinol-phosphate aminotransferase